MPSFKRFLTTTTTNTGQLFGGGFGGVSRRKGQNSIGEKDRIRQLVYSQSIHLCRSLFTSPPPSYISTAKNRFHPLLNDSGSASPEDQEDLKTRLKKAYESSLAFCQSKKLPEDVDPEAVFAVNRLNLREIEAYGFDYDYTLANYKNSLQHLIYKLGRDVLINDLKYPTEIKDLQYNQKFAIRGLHYDIKKGLLLKVDSFMQIQLGCVYRGLTKLSDDEVIELYGSRKIPLDYIEGFSDSNGRKKPHKTGNMVQLADLFSLPEMNLLCNVANYLHQNNIDFHPESLFLDVKESVQSVHPIMHDIVSKDPSKYLHYDPKLREYLQLLIDNGKKLFLITNSPYNFVNSGLSYIIGEDWFDFFDVTVVSARKPGFFSNESIPFRIYDPKYDTRLWERVTSLEKGKVYYGGTLKQFQKMTGWNGERVLYFGDHPSTDLAEVTLQHGWRTGAIIRELEHEIITLNSQDFKYAINWLTFLTSLLEAYQGLENPEIQGLMDEYHAERKEIRKKAKIIFNEHFGSVFRTHLNPSFFTKRLFRFADVYTSSITNLNNYSPTHTFYPRRGALPHEYRSWFN